MQLVAIKALLKKTFKEDLNLVEVAGGKSHREGDKYLLGSGQYNFLSGDLSEGSVNYYSTQKVNKEFLIQDFKDQRESLENKYFKGKVDQRVAHGPTSAARYVYVCANPIEAERLTNRLVHYKDKEPYLADHLVTWVDATTFDYTQRSFAALMAHNLDARFIVIGKRRFDIDMVHPNVIKREDLDHWRINSRTDFIEIQALGSTPDAFYYASNYKNGELKIPVSHSRKHILALAPEKYWRELGRFNKVTRDGRTFVNYEAVGTYLMGLCSKIGQYDGTVLRGSGYYWNTKTKALYCRSGFVFAGVPEAVPHGYGKDIYVPRKVESRVDSDLLLKIFDSFCWQEEYYARVLMGWCLLAPFCGALKFRPHVWINGERSSGKTWIITNVVNRLLKYNALSFSMSTTEAALLGQLANNAIPIVHDEFESKQDNNHNKSKLIEFFRGCSTSDDGDCGIVRYSPGGGKIRKYQARSMVLLGSIRNSLEEPQDICRFITIGLSKYKRKKEFKEIQKLCEGNPLKIEHIFRTHINHTFVSFDKVAKLIRVNEELLMKAYPMTTFHSLRAIAAIQSILQFYDFELSQAEIKKMVDKFNNDDINESGNVLDAVFLRQFWLYGRKSNLHNMIISAFDKKIKNKEDEFYEPELRRMGVKLEIVDHKSLSIHVNPRNRLFNHYIVKDNLPRNWKSILGEEDSIRVSHIISFYDYFSYIGGSYEDNKGKKTR